jgi:radical SAM superfamily enzyme YgiQ (UPF0313 family)
VLNPARVEEICDRIIERKYDLNMWAYARVDTISEPLLKKMKQAGINWLGLGIESASDRVLQGVNKSKVTKEKTREAVRLIHENGMYVGGNYIFGLPEDDLSTMRETLDFAKELNCEFANFYCAMAYPGSKLYEKTQKEMLPKTWSGYSQYSSDTFPLSTKYISNIEVLKFRDLAFHEYNESDRYLFMMKEKFGQKAVDSIKQMCRKTLRRELFETTNIEQKIL